MAKVKVVQCWDDGVITDIRLIEILKKYNAKATFNLNVGLHPEKRGIMEWIHDPHYPYWTHKGFKCGKLSIHELTEIYAGFEVASHCMHHENAGMIPDAEFLKAAKDAKDWLENAFGRACRGFAWPCGRYTPETGRLLREAGFAYGRVVENTSDVTACADTMFLKANCHFMHDQFYRIYEEAKKTGVFYFWGHSYETLDYDRLWDQLEDKIRYISEDPDAEWVNVIDIVPLCGAASCGQS